MIVLQVAMPAEAPAAVTCFGGRRRDLWHYGVGTTMLAATGLELVPTVLPDTDAIS